MTDDQIKHMVNRFLGWKLPDNFNPDAGITFERSYPIHGGQFGIHEPTGTNLFDYTQAEAMVRYMLEGMPAVLSSTDSQSVGDDVERLRNALTQHRPQCSCVEVYGEDPHCIKHGRGTDWAKENPDICQLAEKAARAAAAESRLDALVEALEHISTAYVTRCYSGGPHVSASVRDIAADALKKVGR